MRNFSYIKHKAAYYIPIRLPRDLLGEICTKEAVADYRDNLIESSSDSLPRGH